MAIYTKEYDSTKKSKDRVKAEIVFELEKLGYNKYLTWKEFEFSASVGWGSVLSLEGNITDDSIIINKCSGAFGSKVLDKIKELSNAI